MKSSHLVYPIKCATRRDGSPFFPLATSYILIFAPKALFNWYTSQFIPLSPASVSPFVPYEPATRADLSCFPRSTELLHCISHALLHSLRPLLQ